MPNNMVAVLAVTNEGYRARSLDKYANLCYSCIHSYPDCDADNIEFGECPGSDNIVECDSYEEKEEE